MEESSALTPLASEITDIVASRRKFLEKIQSKIKGTLYILWGSWGSGKSWTLKQIALLYKKSKRHCGYIDFSNLVNSTDKLHLAVLQQYSQAIGLVLPEQDKDIDALAAQIVQNAQTTPTNFLIDNLDCLLRQNEEVFYWMERVLISPLLALAGSQIVATSGIPIQRQWRDYETRRRCQTLHIQPFDRDDLTQLLNLDDAGIVEYAYQVTAGHPKAIEWYREIIGMNEINVLNAPEVQRHLWQQEISKRAKDYFLGKLPQDLAQTASLLSHLRWFNVALLRNLMPDAKAVDDSFYLEKINRLNRAGLTTWDINRGAYRFTDPAVRLLLSEYERGKDPQKCAETHRLSHEYYAGETRYVEYLSDTLPEVIYHYLWWKTTSGTSLSHAAQSCLDWLRSEPYLEWRRAESQNWEEVRKVLDGSYFKHADRMQPVVDYAEADSEIARKYAVEELKQIMPSDTYSALLEFLQEYSQLIQENSQ